MSTPVLDLVFTYQFLRRLATPFEKWDAFKYGIIDKDGKVLRKRKTLKKSEEISAWGYFDRMVANLKKLLGKVPGGKTTIASYAAALLLLREQKSLDDLDEVELENSIESLFEQYYNDIYINEEIANVVGSGKIAGVGIGPQGEPPVTSRKPILRRKNINRVPK